MSIIISFVFPLGLFITAAYLYTQALKEAFKAGLAVLEDADPTPHTKGEEDKTIKHAERSRNLKGAALWFMVAGTAFQIVLMIIFSKVIIQ